MDEVMLRHHLSRLGPWSCVWLVLLLLAQQQRHADAATAYLVDSQQQIYSPANSSFNNLRAVLSSLQTFNTIVLTEDYDVDTPKEYAADPVRLVQDLLITSQPGQRYQLSFAFLSNVVLMNNYTVTLRNIVINQARKTSGQSVQFFSGEGVLLLDNVVRRRIACSAVINASVSTLRTTPRPRGFPGTQEVSLIDYEHRGVLYPDSVHVGDVALFVSPGDVEDAAYYAGYSVVQTNVTRVCDQFVPPGCNEQCLQQTVDAILAAQANTANSGAKKQQQLVATVVPAVVVPVVVLLAAAVAGVLWQRKRRSARQAALLQQQQQAKLEAQMEEGSRRAFVPGGPDFGKGPGGRALLQLAPHGPGVPVGLLGRGLDMGAVGSIEEVAVGATADQGARNGWHLMACHTAPEFPEATAKDAITLGVLLGAGSFGRVYRGRWRGLDVAVKVLHHDVNTAASVANEVDLVMSFRHPNITTAYHFLTWNYAHDTGDGHTSGSCATRTSPDQAAAGGSFTTTGFRAAAAVAAVATAAGAAAAGGAGAVAGGSSTANGPTTPSMARTARPSADFTSSGEHHALSGSSVQRTGLFVIQSQSAGSSAAHQSGSAGGSSSRVNVPAATGAAAASSVAAATSAFSWGSAAVRLGPNSSSSGGSGPHSSSSGPLHAGGSGSGRHGAVRHVPHFGTMPLLQHLESPQSGVPAAAVGAQGALAPAAGATAAAANGPLWPRIGSASFGPSTSPSSAVQSAGGGAAVDQSVLAAGATSPDATTGPSWTPSRLMPVWAPKSLNPAGQGAPGVSGWTLTGSGTGQGVQSFTGGHRGVRPDQQQQQQRVSQDASLHQHGQQQQEHEQPLQQEFVPMVRYGRVQHGDQAGEQHSQQRYLPLVQAQQQQQGEHSGTSSPSNLSVQQLSSQLRQLQLARTARFDPGSGSGSYVGGLGGTGGGGKARSGEAQTWLILEYCDGGTLLDLMQEGLLLSLATGELNLAHVLTLLADVAAGMNYLHLRNCVHGDLKPANVLLKKKQGAPFGHVAKVSDFGLSKSLTAGQSHRSTRTLGTFNRAPPELLRLGRLSPSCDVYAFGVLIWELFTGQVAFTGLHYGEVFERVALRQERPPVPFGMPTDLSSLMVACWGPDPMARPTFRMIQQSIADMISTLPDSGDMFVSDL